jgi:peptidyl-prolyl cis-trans isomerase A (cyclophilin A)
MRRTRATLASGLVAAALVTLARASEGLPEIPAVETHLIASKQVNQTFRVQVMQPARRPGETTRLPVVYATDGNLTFDMLKGISYILQSSGHEAPRFILVGIGYPGDSPMAGAVLRGRDLTFPGYPKFRLVPRMAGVLVAEPGTKDFYGAEDFQRFIREELIPLIDGNYPTLPGERTYFGHSAGGGFGLFTLFTQTDLFNNYIISSPGLIYHGKSSAGSRYDNYDFVLRDARKFLDSGKSVSGIRLYLSVGADEEFEPGLAEWRLTSSFYRMAAMMKGASAPGLHLTTEVFAGETHLTAWPMAFIHGVRAVFPTAAASQTIVSISTQLGEIVVALDAQHAPATVGNFLRYVDKNLYDGGAFHRTVTPANQPESPVKTDIVQAGIATSRDSEKFAPVPLERTSGTGLKHRAGTISMARSGADTATSEFFICVTDRPELDFGGSRNPDGQGYAAFGQVIKGMEIVRAIHRSPAEGQRLAPTIRIESIRRIHATP